MNRIVISMLSGFCLMLITATYGMKCPVEESTNVLDHLLESCPRFYENVTKSFCCVDQESKTLYCCEEDEYVKYQEGKSLSPGMIALAVIVPSLILAIFGICWYFKVHPGIVYNRTSNA